MPRLGHRNAGAQGEIKLWDVKTGKNFATLVGHGEAVLSVAYSPDGKTLASGSGDKTVKLWDVKTGKNTPPSTGTLNPCDCRGVQPGRQDPRLGGRTETVKVWDVTDGQEHRLFRGAHATVVTSVAYSPDGKTLASGSGDKTVKLWDVKTGKERATLTGHSEGVDSVAYGPDGKTAGVGGRGQDGQALGREDRQGTGHPHGPHGSGVLRGVQSGRQDLGIGELGQDDKAVGYSSLREPEEVNERH